MDAILLANSGAALLLDGASRYYLHLREIDSTVKRASFESPFFLDKTETLRLLNDVTIEEATEQLKQLYNREEALDLFLILLDGDLSRETRQGAAVALKDALRDDRVTFSLKSILYSRPIPGSVDFTEAEVISEKCDADSVSRLLEAISSRQDVIARAHQGWAMIPRDLFADAIDQTSAEILAMDSGLFVNLVECLVRGNVDRFRFQALDTLSSIKGFREIVNTWCRNVASGSVEKIGLPIMQDLDPQDSIFARKKHPPQRLSLDRGYVLDRVNRQKQAIVSALRHRNFKRALKFTDDLIVYHAQSGGDQFACKSLCDLATQAKNLKLFDWQLNLTTLAIQQYSADGWAWAQHGDAYATNRRFGEALKAYAQAANFGQGQIANRGRAVVLKLMGRLPEALRAYDEIVRDFPSDLVARHGRAEVLKAMNRLPEALATYDEIIQEDVTVVPALNGRADVLKEMNRLPEALAAYDEIIQNYPTEVIPRAGRAEVLKAMNRLPESLAAYDEVIRDFPTEAIPRNGRAEVLKAMNRLPEALAAYDEIIRSDLTNVEALDGRAGVLKEMNRLPEALASYDEIIQNYPTEVIARAGRAEVLKAMNRLPEALAAYDEVIRDFPTAMIPRCGRAEVLKAMNRLSEALAAYDETIRNYPTAVVPQSGRAELLKTMNRLPEALTTYDEIIHNYPTEVIPRNGRAGVLKAMGNLNKALEAYSSNLRDFPNNPYANIGRAAILVAMGAFEDALATLQPTQPVSRSDWVATHVRGMALLALGKVDEALEIFGRGSREAPLAERDYFRSALALVRIRKGEPELAEQVLEHVTDPQFVGTANILRLHALSLVGNTVRAIEVDRKIDVTQCPGCIELTEELRRRYIKRLGPRHSDEWVIQSEAQCLLMVA
jgi:tetratricopeptide (TPR) repeat protein